jgi:uncharacterized cupredoxin-like copper-binding protein
VASAAVVVALGTLVAACSGSDADEDGGGLSGSSATSTGESAGGARTIEIEMTDNEFSPERIEVTAGETVHFVFANEGEVTHDAVIGDEAAQDEHESVMRAVEALGATGEHDHTAAGETGAGENPAAGLAGGEDDHAADGTSAPAGDHPHAADATGEDGSAPPTVPGDHDRAADADAGTSLPAGQADTGTSAGDHGHDGTDAAGLEAAAHADGNAVHVAPGETGELTYTFAAGVEVLIGCHELGHFDSGMTVAVEVTDA